MKKIIKSLVIGSITCLSVTILLLILSLFEVLNVFEGGALQAFFWTVLVFCVYFFFLISSLSLINENKKLSITSASFLTLSLVFALVNFWSIDKELELFQKITIVISVTTILFVIIIRTIIKLDKKYLILQIATYLITFIIDVIIVLSVFGSDILDGDFSKFFIAMCLVCFTLLSIINILASKKKVQNDEYVTIKKTEYLALLEKIKLYEGKDE